MAAAIAAMAAAAAVAIVAAAFAIYALLRPQLGPAGAAAAVAAGFAVLTLLGGLAAWLNARPKRLKASARAGSGDTAARLMQLVRERPIIAAATLVAGSVLAMRNPAITALVVKSFFDSKRPEKR